MRKTKEPKQRCVFAHFAHTIAPLRGGCFNQQFHLPSFRERGMARHTPLFKVNMHSHPSAARHITPATSVAAARHHRKHTRRERRAQTHTNSLWGHTRKLPTCLWHVTFAGCNVAKKKKKKGFCKVSQAKGALVVLSQIDLVRLGQKAEQRRLTVIMDEPLHASPVLPLLLNEEGTNEKGIRWE